MDFTLVEDLGIAYVSGIAAGAPVGFALVSMSGQDSLMTVTIVAAMCVVLVKRRAERVLPSPAVARR